MEIPIYNSLCSCFSLKFPGQKGRVYILAESPAKAQPAFTEHFTQLASEMFAQLFASICFSSTYWNIWTLSAPSDFTAHCIRSQHKSDPIRGYQCPLYPTQQNHTPGVLLQAALQ